MNCAHAFEVVGGGEQLVALGRVDAVIVGMRDRRRGDAEMHLAWRRRRASSARSSPRWCRARCESSISTMRLPLTTARLALCLRRTPSSRIVLGRLDEGAADIVVADDAELVGDAGGLRVADRGRHAGIGHRHDHVGVGRRLARELGAHGLAHVVDACGRRRSNPAARNRCIRRCTAAAASAGTACATACRPRRTPRPRRSRRRARIWRR